MNKLACFTVVKPQGIKGELKAKILADGISNVKNVKTLYDDNGNEFKVKSVKDAFGGFAFIALENVVTRNDSELFRGVTFYAEKSQILKNEGDYFIADLIGLKVIASGEVLGVVNNVLQSNVDMFEIDLQTGKKAFFPFLKSLNLNVDLKNGVITVEKSLLDGVVFYED